MLFISCCSWWRKVRNFAWSVEVLTLSQSLSWISCYHTACIFKDVIVYRMFNSLWAYFIRCKGKSVTKGIRGGTVFTWKIAVVLIKFFRIFEAELIQGWCLFKGVLIQGWCLLTQHWKTFLKKSFINCSYFSDPKIIATTTKCYSHSHIWAWAPSSKACFRAHDK